MLYTAPAASNFQLKKWVKKIKKGRASAEEAAQPINGSQFLREAKRFSLEKNSRKISELEGR